MADITLDPINPDQVLGAAIGELTDVIVIGYQRDGEEYHASSSSDKTMILWMLKRMEQRMLRDPGTDMESLDG